MESSFKTPYFLGLDIGTTSLSANVIDVEGRVVATYTAAHGADITIENYPDAYAQDVSLLASRAEALARFYVDAYPAISAIGITGQMHGILCIDGEGTILSPLYTWRCAFGNRHTAGKRSPTVSEEIEALCGEAIPTGYGVNTLYALKRFGLFPENTKTVTTIMDLVASRLGGALLIHPTNAASLGGYDIRKRCFSQKLLKKLSLSDALFPKIAEDYGSAGVLERKGRRIAVSAALGDNQAAIYGSLKKDDMVLVNVGTGSQVSVIAEKAAEGCEMRPYVDGKVILSGAALCGGRAYAALSDFVKKILSAFGKEVRDSDVYDYLNTVAEGGYSTLSVSPAFCGKRDDPDATGKIEGITLDNFTPDAFAYGMLKGIVRELYDMYAEMGVEDGRIPVVSGNAMRKNPLLRRICGNVFGREALMPYHTEEAAFGAALFGAVSAGLMTDETRRLCIRYGRS